MLSFEESRTVIMSYKLDLSDCFLMLRCKTNIFGKKYYIDDSVYFLLCHFERHVILVCPIIIDVKFDLFIVKVPTPFCK